MEYSISKDQRDADFYIDSACGDLNAPTIKAIATPSPDQMANVMGGQGLDGSPLETVTFEGKIPTG